MAQKMIFRKLVDIIADLTLTLFSCFCIFIFSFVNIYYMYKFYLKIFFFSYRRIELIRHTDKS